jgi:hypothetical protein
VQVLEKEKQDEEQKLLQVWMWDRSVGDSIRLAAEVKQLLLESTSIAQQEARMKWRMQRWALQGSRQQLLEVWIPCMPVCASEIEMSEALHSA